MPTELELRRRAADDSIAYLETDEGARLLECYARDGVRQEDIAKRLGIPLARFYALLDRKPSLRRAIQMGREAADYKVEDALYRRAVGYEDREVKVTEEIRHGRVISTFKEVTTRTLAPDTKAIGMWLYNRRPDKWRQNRDVLLDLEEEERIHITVERAGSDETGTRGLMVDVEEGEDGSWEVPEPDDAGDSPYAPDGDVLTTEEEAARDAERMARRLERERIRAYSKVEVEGMDEVDSEPQVEGEGHVDDADDANAVDSVDDPDSLDYWPEDLELD